jgi:hypothetical protein
MLASCRFARIRGCSRSLVRVSEEIEQLADGPLPEESLRQRLVDLDPVAVATASFVFEHVFGFHEVGDDAVCGTLCDAERGGDLPQTHARVVGDAQQRLSVVRQETPGHETETISEQHF